jgi:hypothetical protein
MRFMIVGFMNIHLPSCDHWFNPAATFLTRGESAALNARKASFGAALLLQMAEFSFGKTMNNELLGWPERVASDQQLTKGITGKFSECRVPCGLFCAFLLPIFL